MAAQPTLSNFELMVMLAIIRIGDGAYGVSITSEIENTTGSEVLLGSVYDAVARLEEKGLIVSSLGEATPERGGRAKRHFRTTSRGLRVQMDHTVEVKWGGPASPDGLLALGSRVNNFFGSICKRTGDDMMKGTPPQEEISAVHFVCNPPCRPPKAADKNKNYSTGPAGKSPPAPVGGNPVRTYLAD